MADLTQIAAALLGEQSQDLIRQENPYYQFVVPAQAFSQGALNAQTTGENPRAEMWNKAIAASLGGLLGGGLQGLGNNYQNVLTDRYQRALGASLLGQEPSAEGLSPGLFGAAKRGGTLFKAVRGAANVERGDEIGAAIEGKLAETAITKPWLLGGSGGSGEQVGELAGPVEPKNDLMAVLKTQPLSMEEKRRARYQANLQSGMDPIAARMAARDDTAAELKASIGSVDQAKKAREHAEGLLELADRAESGLSVAGETGAGDAVRKLQLNARSLFGDKEADTRLAGRKELDSIRAELVKMLRSPGAVSDYENRMILSGGPTTSDPEVANRSILNNWRELAQYNLDYADFLDAYRETNGTVAGAEKLWSEYRKAYPLYKETVGEGGTVGEIATERPSWQEFFVQLAQGGAPEAGAPKGGNMESKDNPPPPRAGKRRYWNGKSWEYK